MPGRAAAARRSAGAAQVRPRPAQRRPAHPDGAVRRRPGRRSCRSRPAISSTVEFAPDERIENVAVGDSGAWQVTPNKRGDHLFVKPLQARRHHQHDGGDRRAQPMSSSSSPAIGRRPQAVHRPLHAIRRPPAADDRRRRRGRAAGPLQAERRAGAAARARSPTTACTPISLARRATLPAVYAIDRDGRETLADGAMRDGRYVHRQHRQPAGLPPRQEDRARDARAAGHALMATPDTDPRDPPLAGRWRRRRAGRRAAARRSADLVIAAGVVAIRPDPVPGARRAPPRSCPRRRPRARAADRRRRRRAAAALRSRRRPSRPPVEPVGSRRRRHARRRRRRRASSMSAAAAAPPPGRAAAAAAAATRATGRCSVRRHRRPASGGSADARPPPTAPRAPARPAQPPAAAPQSLAARARAGVLRQPRDHRAAGHADPRRARDRARFDPARPGPRAGDARRARLRRQPGADPARQPADRRIQRRLAARAEPRLGRSGRGWSAPTA